MNKQLEEGKRLAELANKCEVGHFNLHYTEYTGGQEHYANFLLSNSPETMLKIYAHIEKLEAENERFKAALEYYADATNWVPNAGDIRNDRSFVTFHNGTIGKFSIAGKRAREALKGT